MLSPEHASMYGVRALPHKSRSRECSPHLSTKTNSFTTTMSSDYGSDILLDDIPAIENAHPDSATACAPPATPRAPLKPRNVNVLATPPPSQTRTTDAAFEPTLKPHNYDLAHQQHQTSRRHAPIVAYATPRTSPGRHVTPYQHAPPSSQPLLTPLMARTPPSPHYIAPSSQFTPSRRPIGARPPDVPPIIHPSRVAHNVPPSSQPAPSTARPISSPCYIPPPSSQPTPLRKPTQPRLAAHPSSLQPSRSHDAPPSSQPKASRQPGDAPLYRFPFGAHRGKTLLEVPENYIAYLRIDQDMADNMPGFNAALRLFDAGQPPIVPPPQTASTQPSPRDVPPSSAPARMSASQHTTVHEEPPSTPLSQGEYRFDFGMHAGKTLSEVPSDYINFLKQRGIVESKPALAVAVIKHEREHPPSASITASRSDPASYTLKFGKHIGKTLQEVPSDYLAWLKSSNIYTDSHTLQDAFAYYERTHRSARTPVSSKRKRAPEVVSVGYLGGSGRRRHAPKKKMRIW